MAKIIIGTDYVTEDEPCLELSEIIVSQLGKQHRHQVIKVVRNGSVMEFVIDLGNVKKFKDVDMFRIPGGIVRPDGKIETVHTVGQLRDIAEQLRQKNILDKSDRIMSGTNTKKTRTNRKVMEGT